VNLNSTSYPHILAFDPLLPLSSQLTNLQKDRTMLAVERNRVSRVRTPGGPTPSGLIKIRKGKPMSKKAAEHHKKASEHSAHASRHHGEAAKQHEAGNHEKAAHHAHTARGHERQSRAHADDAAMAHVEEHGKKS
jgi:hypothetical protein